MVKAQNVDEQLLNDYIEKSGYKIGYICEQLGISRQAFDKKLKNVNKFRVSEVYVLCDLCRIPDADKHKIFLF